MSENLTPTPDSLHNEALGTPHVYKSVDDRDLTINVVTPPGWTSGDKRPALVFFHGGGWTKGTPAVLNDQAEHYAAKGMVCFLVQYRLVERGSHDSPDICMRDAKSAMRWVRSHASEFGIDPNRIAAGGGSAGAQLSLCTALIDDFNEPSDDLSVSPLPQALVLFNPVLDMGPDGFAYYRTGARYAEFSPIHNIRPGTPPAIILSGSEDRVVPVATAYAFRDAMEQCGARCDVHIYPGQTHGFYRKFESEGKYFYLTLCEVDAFFASLGWLPVAPGETQSEAAR